MTALRALSATLYSLQPALRGWRDCPPASGAEYRMRFHGAGRDSPGRPPRRVLFRPWLGQAGVATSVFWLALNHLLQHTGRA